MTRVVDFHQHLWPEGFQGALRARRDVPRLDGDALVTVEGTFPFDARAHDVERRLEQLAADGVDLAVLSLQPSLGAETLEEGERRSLEDAWLTGVQELCDASGGRLTALAPWRVAPGLPGTSIGAGALLDLGAHAGLLDEVERAGGVLFVHPEAVGPPEPGRPGWWGWTTGYTAQMQRAYLAWLGERERWPGLRVVFAILAGGAPFQLERLANQGVDVRSALEPNVFFDVATYGRRAIELCIETFGVGQLVYGSDVPVVDSSSTLQAVRGFGDAVARVIQIETPGVLLP